MASPRPNPFPKSTTIILSTAELASSPHFPALYAVINEAFGTAGNSGMPGKEFCSVENGRFDQPQDMLDELGPAAFTMITFESAEGSSDIIGSISAKPFNIAPAPTEPNKSQQNKEVNTHLRLHFKRTPSTVIDGAKPAEEEEGEKWELLMSAVSLKVKGMGAASWLMEKCVGEIRKRSRDKVAWKGVGKGEAGGEKGEPRIVLYLSTMQELNEEYYLKRGWRTTGVKRVEAGMARNRDSFGVVEMVKVV